MNRTRIVSIDNSVISYIGWHRMHSRNFRNVTDCEIAEFTRNYAEISTYISTLFEADMTFILNDSTVPIWRDEYQLNYYCNHAKSWSCDDTFKLLVNYDDKFFPIRYDQALGEWVSEKNITKKARETDGFWDVWTEDEVLRDAAIDFLPHYKGNRSKVWNYGTDKDEFKRRANDVSYAYAPQMNAMVLQGDHIEADDIMYQVIKAYPDAEHFMVTTDRDWSQMMALSENIHMYDPKEKKMLDMNPASAKLNFYTKMLGGDSGDNIPGAMILNKKTGNVKKYGEVSAKKMLQEVGHDEMWAWMKDNMSPSLERNIQLISLKRGAQYLEKKKLLGEVQKKIKNWKVSDKDTMIEDFNTSNIALRMARQQARKDRSDLGIIVPC